MTDDGHGRAKKLFVAALELPPEERRAFLEKEAAGDRTLIDEVESLLGFHEETDAGDEPPGQVRSRLSTGELFADRYRILGLLGRGGMGEVYHAQDELLNVSVALKRLTDAGRLRADLLLQEVRLARQVTHPSICRVFDVGEWHGERFLTMEYVDGEDLASLIRRIGQLPSGKVEEIAYELCVGLAAAHAKGVLHRDLKPANILIDGEGRVRITDFGIAMKRTENAGPLAIAGTPAYMAPEQLVPGGLPTEQSDLYALGLVLHELLTGKPVFPGSGLTEAAELRRSRRPASPSDLATGVDSRLERVVLRALELDPRDRPATALEMAAELRGGDPLDAAREAGVTPSPEIVANAPSQGRMDPAKHSGAWLAALGVLLVAVLAVGGAVMELPSGAGSVRPAVRAHRASETLRSLGIPAADGATRFHGFLADPTAADGETELLFWYREDFAGPRTLFQRTVLDPARRLIVFDRATGLEPSRVVAAFDSQDRLVYLESAAAVAGDPAPANWAGMLAPAGLKPDDLIPTAPAAPPLFADERAAWAGTDPENPARNLRVEAAAREGQPVYLSVGLPDVEATERLAQREQRLTTRMFLVLIIFGAALVAGVVMTVRNVRAGRIDWLGARRVALFMALVAFGRWLLLLGHLSHPLEDRAEVLWARLLEMPINALTIAFCYFAFEPDVRRHWPQTLVAWTRVVHGSFWNAATGRALLVGSVAGALLALLTLIDQGLPRWFDMREALTVVQSPRLLAALGLPQAFSVLPWQLNQAIFRAVFALLLLTLFRTRIPWPAVSTTAFVLAMAALEVAGYGHTGFSWLTLGLPTALVYAWVLARSGLLTLIISGFTLYSLRFVPLGLDGNAWWTPGGWLVVAFLAATGALGAWLIRRSSPSPSRRPASSQPS